MGHAWLRAAKCQARAPLQAASSRGTRPDWPLDQDCSSSSTVRRSHAPSARQSLYLKTLHWRCICRLKEVAAVQAPGRLQAAQPVQRQPDRGGDWGACPGHHAQGALSCLGVWPPVQLSHLSPIGRSGLVRCAACMLHMGCGACLQAHAGTPQLEHPGGKG